MALADELLDQAYHLAHKDPDPLEASLRRAISSAYYALFHLLIEDAIGNWNRPRYQQGRLARAFDHGRMKAVSKEIVDRKSVATDPLLDQLKEVAGAFIRLQQERHSADYDIMRAWTRAEVADELERATKAFQTWAVIRNEDVAQDFLVSFLLKR